MRINKLFIVSIFLLIILAVGTVSAANENSIQNITSDLKSDDSQNELFEFQDIDDANSDKEKLQQDLNEVTSDNELKDIDFNVSHQVMKSDYIVLECSEYIDYEKVKIYIDDTIVKSYVDDDAGKYIPEYNMDYFSTVYVPTDYYNKLSLGNHTLKIVFDGDELNKAFSDTYNINITDFNIVFDIPENFVIGRDSIKAYLPRDGAGGNVTIYIDGKQFKKISSKDYNYLFPDDYEFSTLFDKCWIESDLLGMSASNHTIKFVWSGNSEYGTISNQITINADYLLSLNVKGPYIYTKNVNEKGSKIKIKLVGDVKNKPVVKIDGKTYKLNTVKNAYALDISKLSIGTHTLEVTYKEGNKYPSKTVTAKFDVKPVIFTNFDKTIKYGAGKKFSLKLPSNAKGKLSVYISNEKGKTGKLYKSVSLKKGAAAISMDALKTGKYYAHAIYTGKDYKVDDLDCAFTMAINFVAPKAKYYGENGYLIIKSYKSDNREFKICHNYDSYYGKVKLKNGVGKISLKNFPMWDYSAYIDIYIKNKHVGYASMIVKEFTGNKNIKMYYNGGNKYSVKVYNEYGKPAGKGAITYFNIDGKDFRVKTNSKSIASLKINLKPGKHKIIVSGNTYKVSNTILVKHVVKLKEVTIKKSAKKVVLQATLKQGTKALKNKKVIFNFNNTKYTVKTNKNGVAKITVNKSILNKLNVGEKITYSAAYGKDVVKRTVKILK